jgi:hypothetical protein
MADFPLRALHDAWQGAVAQLATVQQHLEHLLALDATTWPRPRSVDTSLGMLWVSTRQAQEALYRVPTSCLEVLAEVWRTLEEPHVEATTTHEEEETP